MTRAQSWSTQQYSLEVKRSNAKIKVYAFLTNDSDLIIAGSDDHNIVSATDTIHFLSS